MPSDTPSERVEQARAELEQEIYDEMSGGPPGRDTRWPDRLDALVATVRAEERARVREFLEQFLERENPDCDYDHTGFCQEHYSHKPCIVERARALLSDREGA